MLKNIKILNVLKQYLYRATRSNFILDSKEIKDSKEMIKRRDDFIPLSGNYRLVEFDKFNIGKFVAEIDMLTIDKNVVRDYIHYLYEAIQNRLLLNEIQKRIAKNKINKIGKDITYLISNQFIEGFTTIFNFKKDFINNESEIEINANNISLKTHLENIPTKKKYVEDSVSISVKKYLGVPDIGKNEPEVSGAKLSLIDESFGNGIYVKVFSILSEIVGINIRANIDAININTLTLFLEEPEITQHIKVSIDPTGSDLKTVYDQIVKTDHITINFAETDVKYIYIEIEQALPNFTINGLMGYKFNLKKIKFAQTNFLTMGTLISNPIKINTDTKFITLVAEEIIPEKTQLVYKISYNKNEKAEWINFKEVKPVTRENKKENYIKIGVKNYLETIKPEDKNWSGLIPDKTFGGKLYKIKDLSDAISGKNILENSIALYRGIDDWSITKQKISEIKIYSKIPLHFIWDSVLKGYSILPICVEYEEECEPVNANSLKLKYKIKKDMDYSFKDDKFNRINLTITNWDSTPADTGATIVTTEKLIPGKKYKVKYFFSLNSITDKIIKIKDIRVYNTLVVLEKETDYNIVDYTDILNGQITKSLEILKNSKYTGEPLYLDITINFENKKDTKVYKTFFFSESNINLDIGAFTKEEIDKGNYHKINGEDISKNTSYNITYGYYTIETTAPYIGMLNSITGNTSGAYINIPKNVIKKGFEASLRKIPIYELVLNQSGDDRQFSFYNNSIFLNRVPDFVTSEDSIDIESKYLKCIKINDDGAVEAIPETFRLEFDYIDNEQVKEIAIQIILRNDDKEISKTPEVKKLGINEFNVDI